LKRSPFMPVLAVAASCVLANGMAFAQTSKGAISGVAKDPSGAAIGQTVITIKGEQTGETRTLTTGADGSFRVDALSPENYTISAEHEGFSKFTAQHVSVGSSTVTTYNVTLNVGSRGDTITVEASGETLNTENGQLAGTISANELAKLPVFTLNPLELASTVPGVQTVPAPDTNQLSNGVNLQVDGARPRSNNFLLDSQEINDVGIGGQAFQPNIPDLYENLTVLTSVASAEFGRSGGGVFNLVTKSGSNSFHGSVYDRYTSAGLNAVPNSLRGTDTPNPRQTSHTIGATGGGYIIKDKLFVYGGTQFQRFYGNTQISPVTLPTAAGVATLNSLTGVSAQQVALLKQYTANNAYLGSYAQVTNQPTSNVNIGVQPGCAASAQGGNCFVEEALFQRPAAALQNPDTQWSVRVDFKPSDKDSFYFRYLHDRQLLTPDFFANEAGGALGLDTQQGGTSELGAGSWTHVFTGNVLNELRVSETRINFSFAPTAATLANPAYSLPLLNLPGFPSSSLGPQTGAFPQGRAEDLYQVQDTFTYTHGRQSIRAGFDIGRQLEKDTIGVNAGTINYAKGTAQSALQNFLANQTGSSGSVTKTIGPRRTDPHVWRSGFFFQDDVKFAPNFTVNLGMRYDYTGNPENSLAYPGIDESNPYQPLTTVVRVKNDKNNLSPRIGFAYTPNQGGMFGSGKTVLRGGFGMFYDSYFSNFVTNAAQSAPNAIAGSLTSNTGVGIANANAALASFTPTLNTNASQTTVSSNLRNPVSYQYNLGIEQSVANAILAVRYVGVRSYDLFANSTLNPFSGVTGTRLNTSRGAITVRDNSASGNYNGLQTEFSRRFGSYLSVHANYTFSKSLDNGSEIFAIGDSNTSAPAILGPVGRRQEYAPSAFDHRHYASISYAFTPKGFHVANKFADTIVGALTRNYTFAGVEQFQSGSYGTFRLGSLDNNGDGSAANDRPILGNARAPFQTVGIDGSFVGGTPGVYYNNVAFNDPSNGALIPVTADQVHFLIPNNRSGQFNSRLLGRNSFSNPGTTRNDITVQKGFGTGLLGLERGLLLLRMDVQNIANHNDRGPYLETDILQYGTGPTSFETQSLARQGSLGRNIVLWGKFTF